VGASSCEAMKVRMGAVCNFQVKNKNLGFLFSHFWRLIQDRKIHYLAKSREERYGSYTCVCICGASFPRSALTWSWSNNYLKIGLIINLFFVNQIATVTLADIKRKSDMIFSAAYSSWFLCLMWLVSEAFPEGGILEANPQICWTSKTWSQFKNEFTFLLHL